MTLAQISPLSAFIAGFLFGTIGLSVIFAGVLFDISQYNKRKQDKNAHKEAENE